MKQRWIAAALLTGILGVGVEYWVLFGGGTTQGETDPGSVELYEDEELSEEKAGLGSPPAPVSSAQVTAMLLTASPLQRSPFLTRSEQKNLRGRDAFRLPRLSGVLISSTRRIAWLDDRPRGPGELFEDYVVEKIEPSYVVLKRGSSLISISIEKSQPEPIREEGSLE